MGVREFTNSGTFIAVVFTLVVVLVPFGLEQIGETTGLFAFPVRKTLAGWFTAAPAQRGGASFTPVDWERCRRDLEAFTQWAESRRGVSFSRPSHEEVAIKVEDDRKPARRMWPVPVAGCTAGDPAGHRKGYVFVAGFDRPFEEGAVIAPSEELCGYEIVFVGERSAWFRAIDGDEDGFRLGAVKFPEFTRVEPGSLVRGGRRYVARDAFPLVSGGWLMLDALMPPDGAVFKILDAHRRVVASVLCVVIDEKGGK